MNRRVLIISPHFPPTNAPDAQRVRTSLPYYQEYGWDPVVLAVDARQAEAPTDEWLLRTLPAGVPVHRTSAVPARWSRLAGCGNLGYRAWWPLRRRAGQLLARERFDLVFFSTTQFVTTSLGRRWRARFGVPFVVDIQDPWRTDYYERPGAPPPPGGWKYRFARWQAARIEEPAWRDAAGFISVSPRYLDLLGHRYPWFRDKPATVIPFGAPEADFELARQHPEIPAGFSRVPGMVHVVSVGAVGPMMKRAVETLLAGIAEWRRRHPPDAGRLRVHFIGTSYAPPGRAGPSVATIAAAHGLSEIVTEHPERIGSLAAIRTMVSADAIFLPGSDDEGYSPSKIGACFLAQRPVLAVLAAGSAAELRVRALNFARIVTAGGAGANTQVADFLDQLGHRPAAGVASARNDGLLAAETARAGTTRQCAFFDRVLAAAAKDGSP